MSEREVPFVSPSHLVLRGVGLEAISEENFRALQQVLDNLDINMVIKGTHEDTALYQETFERTAADMEMRRNEGRQTWNALTGHGRLPRTVMSVRDDFRNPLIDRHPTANIPKWRKRMFLGSDSISWRGLSRALSAGKLETLPDGRVNIDLIGEVVLRFNPENIE